MPKLKRIGPCSVIGCGRPIEVNSMCQKHNYRMWRWGRTDLVNTGKRSHPLYTQWYERKDRNALCRAWLDFDIFVSAIGERPSPNHYLGRLREYDDYGPDNFEWRLHIRGSSEETAEESHARKWKAQKAKNPNLDIGRHLMREFGITPSRYEEMLTEQGTVCFICREPETSVHKISGSTKRLSVDHCHSTNVVRDLLCSRCNHVIGRIGENRALAHAMADYFDRWENPEERAAQLNRPPPIRPADRTVTIPTEWGRITVSEASQRSGVSIPAIFGRIQRGWPDDRLLIPLRRPRRLIAK